MDLCQGSSPLNIRSTCWIVVAWKQKQAAGPPRLRLQLFSTQKHQFREKSLNISQKSNLETIK